MIKRLLMVVFGSRKRARKRPLDASLPSGDTESPLFSLAYNRAVLLPFADFLAGSKHQHRLQRSAR